MLQRILVASATATTQGTSPGGQCQLGVLMVAAVRFSGTTPEGAGAGADASTAAEIAAAPAESATEPVAAASGEDLDDQGCEDLDATPRGTQAAAAKVYTSVYRRERDRAGGRAW